MTKEYLGLDERIRKCQIEESFENCATRQYIDTIMRKCKCVPYALNGILGFDLVSTI